MLAFGLTKIPTHSSYCWSHSVFYPITLKCYKALQRATFHIEGTHPTCWFRLLLLPCNQTHDWPSRITWLTNYSWVRIEQWYRLKKISQPLYKIQLLLCLTCFAFLIAGCHKGKYSWYHPTIIIIINSNWQYSNRECCHILWPNRWLLPPQSTEGTPTKWILQVHVIRMRTCVWDVLSNISTPYRRLVNRPYSY